MNYFVILTLSIILTLLAIKISEVRSTKMPVMIEERSEFLVASSILSDLDNLPGMQVVREEHFTNKKYRELWRYKDNVLKKLGAKDVPESAYEILESVGYHKKLPYRTLVKKIEKKYPLFLIDDKVKLTTENYLLEIREGGDGLCEFTYDGYDGLKEKVREEIVKYLEQEKIELDNRVNNDIEIDVNKIILAYEDRTKFNGLSKISQLNGVFAREMVKTPNVVSIIALIFSTIASFGIHQYSSNVLAQISLLMLLFFSIEWAIVDIMTMYLDDLFFKVGVISSWLPIVIYSITNDSYKGLIVGGIVTAIIMLFMETVNRIYKTLRGMDGMGFGDTLIIIGTVGVPVSILGDWVMGYKIIMYSFIFGIIGSLLIRKILNLKSGEPFAFGPFLAVGWIISLVLPSFII